MSKDTVLKQYKEVNDQTFKVEVYYSLGGQNYFSGKNESRGYYLGVCPVELTQHEGYTTERYTAFTGVKELLFEVARKSKIAAIRAENLITEEKINERIEYVIQKNGLVA